MPNYSLQVNNSFKPFTMQEMLTPFLLYKDYYDKNEEAINTLTAQADTVEAMAPKGTRAYERYKQYADTLRQQASDLSANGMSIDLRNAINTSKGDYVKQIVPIQKAYETMMKHLDEQRKMGDSRINSYDLARGERNIDDYLDNPELNYETIDANNLYKKSDAAFGALAQRLNNYYLAKGGGNSKIADRFKEEFYKTYGCSPEDATGFMNEVRAQIDAGVSPMEAVANNPVLGSIFRQLYSSTQVDNWGNPNASAKTANVILSAATSSIGKSDVSLVDDYEREKLYDFDIWKRQYKIQHPDNPEGNPISPIEWSAPTYDQTEDGSDMKTALNNLQKAKDYFSSNPKLYTKLKNGYDLLEEWGKDVKNLTNGELAKKYGFSLGNISPTLKGTYKNYKYIPIWNSTEAEEAAKKTSIYNNVDMDLVRGVNNGFSDVTKEQMYNMLNESIEYIGNHTNIQDITISDIEEPIVTNNSSSFYGKYYNNKFGKSSFSVDVDGNPFEEGMIAEAYREAHDKLTPAARKQQKIYAQQFNKADDNGNAKYYTDADGHKVKQKEIDAVLQKDDSFYITSRGKRYLVDPNEGKRYIAKPGAQGDLLGETDTQLESLYNPKDTESMILYNKLLNRRYADEHSIITELLPGVSGTASADKQLDIEYDIP